MRERQKRERVKALMTVLGGDGVGDSDTAVMGVSFVASHLVGSTRISAVSLSTLGSPTEYSGVLLVAGLRRSHESAVLPCEQCLPVTGLGTAVCGIASGFLLASFGICLTTPAHSCHAEDVTWDRDTLRE